MSFEFGVAAPLYHKRVHPRLLVDDKSIAHLRKIVKTGVAKKLMKALREYVGPLVEAVEAVEDMVDSQCEAQHQNFPELSRARAALCSIAIVGVIDQNERAINAVKKVLDGIPKAEAKWNRDRSRYGYGTRYTLHHAYDLVANFMTDMERRNYTDWAVQASIRESLEMIRKNNFLRCAAANIPMAGMITALHGVFAVEGDPGVPDLSAEKTLLLQYLEASLYSELGENGYAHEDIGYGTLMTSDLASLIEVARRAGVYDAYTRCPRYLKFGRSMLAFVQPWGKALSNTGDYGADFGHRAPVFPRIAAATNDRVLLWLHGQLSYPIATSGPRDMSKRRLHHPELFIGRDYQIPVDYTSLVTVEDLKPPVHPSKARVPTQYADRDRGLVTFRSSWKSDATFVVFDGSHRTPAGQGHAHDSGGHFSLSSLGEYFAIDTGRYNIEQDQHNVVLVDGKPGVSTNGEWRMTHYASRLTGYRPDAFVDTSSVDSSQTSDCYWARRTLGLVKDPTNAGVPSYVWTVEDINKNNDFHEFWWQMQVNPRHKIKLHNGHATVQGSNHGNLLDVHIGMPFPNQYPKPSTLEWSHELKLCGSRKYILKDPLELQADYVRLVGNEEYGPSFARPRLLAKVSSYAGRFMSLMIPRKKGAAAPKVERLDSLDNSLAMRVTFKNVEDTIIWAYEHHLLEAGDVVARGNWCVVRRSRKSGKVLAHAIDEGTRLEVAGKPMKLDK
ncbi:MAG: heparinase II/III family protein [Phycisphaeraceae bacterium]|nr:heparinase II/III family protein [Phycisphaeraceae bacterium]